MEASRKLFFSQWNWDDLKNAVDVRVVWALGAVLGTGTVAQLIHWLLRRYKLEQRRQDQRHRCQEAIDSLSSYLVQNSQVNKEQQKAILSLSFSELQAKLKNGQYTPTQVLQAFQQKALDVHKETNCLQEPLREAQELALELESGDNKHLPLYGIPVSIKDRHGIAGYEYSVGLAKLAGMMANEDCVLIKLLKEQGAIPFVKTNVPQTLMAYENSNPVFGATSNPHDKTRGPGGSSGGEAALIAGGGSVLGLGTDIGGSIRMPSALCGTFGLKPTVDRLSLAGMPGTSGQTLIRSVSGPMASEVDGLVAMMRALLTPLMYRMDPSIPPLPFNEKLFTDKRPLKIGYYTFDGAHHPVPSCERAVLETVQTLRHLGHEVVEWDFAQYGRRILPQYFASLFGDGGKLVMKMLDGDKIDYSIRMFYIIFSMNSLLSKILDATLGRMYPNFGAVMKSRGVRSVSEWWDLGAKNKELQQEVLEDWCHRGFDAVLSPGFCTPAVPHKLPGITPTAASFTIMYNLIRCPVGSMPVSKVKKEDIDQMDSFPTPDPFHRWIKKAQIGSEGLPVSVQIAALHWQDELCLRIMKDLETALKQ